MFAGLLSAQALIPYALDKWFGLNGNWFLLAGGILLIFTLLRNPEGVAGDFYRRTHKRRVVRAPEPAQEARRAVPRKPRRAVPGEPRRAVASRNGSADQALGLVGMGWAAEGMPADLSMGQRKLVGVARALAAKPRLLCLDEPAAGLDTRESRELGARLRGLAAATRSASVMSSAIGVTPGSETWSGCRAAP